MRKLLGRMHQDYLDYVASNPEAPTCQLACQLDSVIGKAEDAKAILTIAWPESNFQVGLLIGKGRPESARKAILRAMRAVAKACPGRRFPMEACLPDNGTEFHDCWKVEEAMAGGGISAKTFYARPMRSDDKAEAERNHELVRYVFPKWKSLDGLTQADLDSAFSNINSYVRRSKVDKKKVRLLAAI